MLSKYVLYIQWGFNFASESIKFYVDIVTYSYLCFKITPTPMRVISRPCEKQKSKTHRASFMTTGSNKLVSGSAAEKPDYHEVIVMEKYTKQE